MFANLKNKIKEEIGSDVSTVVRNVGSIRGLNRHLSQTGSTSSFSSSQISLDESREENITSPIPSYSIKESSTDLKLVDVTSLSAKDIKLLETANEEWRKRFQTRETELLKIIEKKKDENRIKMLEKEREWEKIVEKYEKEKTKFIEDRLREGSTKSALQTALDNAEEYKKKLHNFQENADLTEGLQSQEMAKIKQLLLAKEQEVKDKSQQLKTSLVDIDNLKAELTRLRRYEDEINNVYDEMQSLKHSVQQEKTQLSTKLAQAEGEEQSTQEVKEQKISLEDVHMAHENKETDLLQIISRFEEEQSKNLLLQLEVDRLKEEIELERAMRANIEMRLEREKSEKDGALLRTALISQEIQIAKQEIRSQELENVELQNRLDNVEQILKDKIKDYGLITRKLEDALQRIQDFEKIEINSDILQGNETILKTNLSDLEEQLHEKNKTIKILQQRLIDMKKTLHRELRVSSSTLQNNFEHSAAILNPSSSQTVTPKHNNSKEDDVNFKYLKHVLIKFLTSREYEALHLTKAVATLLHFSPEEERLLQETLEWKMSWFGSKPNIRIDQTARAIPPS